MINILTIDLEEWFHANYSDDLFDQYKTDKSRVVDNTQRLLNHLEKEDAKATFFVLGCVAQHHPHLISEIHKKGHEIATHGYAHQLIYKQTQAEFKEDIKKSVSLIEDITKEKVIGYRAPSWSMKKETFWAIEILESLNFKYDASIFPIKTFLYGIPDAPRFTYNLSVNERETKMLEIPASTVCFFNKNIPFSGGFYFRALPYWFIKQCIKKINRESHPAIIYLHPREIDPDQPKLKLKGRDAFIHYYGINQCEDKLVKLLKTFKFTSIKNYYQL